MLTESHLARRTRNMDISPIREILKVVSLPGMISLAGGIPAEESFPMDILGDVTETVMAKYGARAFQYDLTEGFLPLREALVEYLSAKGILSTVDGILVSSGSQSVLDGLGKILISPGDRVAVEAPTYLGALQAFAPYEPSYVQIETDEQGLLPEALEAAISKQPVKFVYLVPNFQNPTGHTLSMQRRVAIADILQRFNALLVEDDPYGDLRYQGSPLAPIKKLAPNHVVYISTLSKVLAPGLRMGFCLAPPMIHRWLVLAKQGVDLHTSTFNQALAAEYLSGGHLARHLPRIITLYRPRRQAMLDAMQRFFPSGFHWSKPDGGMFVWVQGPVGMDMQSVNRKAIARNTAFVPGTFFFVRPGDGRETLRLNFTMADESTLFRALGILGEVFQESLDQMPDGRRGESSSGSGACAGIGHRRPL